MADFTCKVDEGYRSACEDLSEYQDTGYCVLHFPGDHKVADFEEARESKLAHKHYDFGGSIFPEGTSDFVGYAFETDASFAGAKFRGEGSFREANFYGLADFRKSEFRSKTDFQ